MWTLNSKDNTYCVVPSKKKITWGKVSSQALKFLKSTYPDVPNFVPMVTKNSKVKDKKSSSYRYGLKLYDLTRYAFDKLKEDPEKNIHLLFEKVNSKKKKRIKPHRTSKQANFGTMNSTDTETIIPDDAPSTVTILNEIQKLNENMKLFKKQIDQRIDERIQYYIEEAQEKIILHTKKPKEETVPFVCPEEKENDSSKKNSVPITVVKEEAPNKQEEKPDVKKEEPMIQEDKPDVKREEVKRTIATNPFQKIEDENTNKEKVSFGKPELTNSKIDLPSVIVNSNDKTVNSIASYILNALKSLMKEPENSSTKKQSDDIVADVTLNADILELNKANIPKNTDIPHKCCMINVNIPVINTTQPKNETSDKIYSNDKSPKNYTSTRSKRKKGCSNGTCFGTVVPEEYGNDIASTFFDDISNLKPKK